MPLSLQEVLYVLEVTRAKEIHGTDCTEDDSAAIKAYMRTLDPEQDGRMIERLYLAWPCEWSEVDAELRPEIECPHCHRSEPFHFDYCPKYTP